MQPRRLLHLVLALATLQPTLGSAADSAPRGKGGVEPPKSVRVHVDWPGEVDREALVLVRLRVHADGHASDMHLQEGSFTEKRFTDEVFHGLRSAKFTPATKDGVPLDDYYGVQPFKFNLGEPGAKGITTEFRRELDKVEKLVKEGDNAGAHFHAQWMVAEKAKLIYEYAVLQAQLAYTHAESAISIGRLQRRSWARNARHRSSAEFSLDDLAPEQRPSYYMLPKEVVNGLLAMRFRLAASKGMLLESIHGLSGARRPDPIPADDPRAKMA